MNDTEQAAPVLGKRERSKIEKRQRILAAAQELFGSRGYEATTTSLISKTAGIATGTLFLYFSSKDDLLIALYADRIRDRIAEFGKRFDFAADPSAQLEDFFTAMMALHEEDRELNRHFIRSIAIIGDTRIARDVNNLARSANLAIARVLIRLQREGVIDRAYSPRTAAQVLFGTYFTSLIEWANGGLDEHQVRLRIKAGVAMVMKAIAE